MNFERNINEDFLDYLLRLVGYKLDNNADIDWSEIVSIAKCQGSGESLRKAMQHSEFGAYKVFKHMLTKIENGMSGLDILEEIKKEKHELKMERIKLQTEKLGLNERDRYKARKELVLEEIRDYISNVDIHKVPEFKPLQNSNKKLIAGTADEHFGKELSIQGLDGNPINVYNEEVYYRRMWEYFAELVDVIEFENISEIKFFALSDAIEGILRVSGLQHLKYGIIESSVIYAKFLATWLNKLSEYVKIDYYACMGNHSEIRPLGSKSGDFAKENMQIVIDEIIALSLSNNKRVTINETRAIQYVDIDGYKILATHGQEEKNLVNSVMAYKDIYDVKVDLMISGHLHNSKQETASLHTKCIQFPSMIGIDSFSMKLKRTSRAEGKIILIKGKKFINIDVDLQ